MKGMSACHTGGNSLTKLVKVRMRKSRRTVNRMNLAGLILGHQMNYLMLLSDLRGTFYFSPSACALCVYPLFSVFVRCGASQLLLSTQWQIRSPVRQSPIPVSPVTHTNSGFILKYLLVTYPPTYVKPAGPDCYWHDTECT
jgi:hypothetical protein